MATTPAAPPHGNWFTRGGWWFLVHVASLGLLAVVPFTHAALRSRRVGHVLVTAVVAAATVLEIALIATADHASTGTVAGPSAALGSLLLMLVLIGGLAGLVVVRHQVYGPRPVPPTLQPAVARALAARGRRDEARRLLATDPLLARELRIGRPDLPREFDDGGLVDLNSAPAHVVGAVCGLDPVHAERIVATRRAVGRFAAVEDVFAWADLPVEIWDQVRDHAVVV